MEVTDLAFKVGRNGYQEVYHCARRDGIPSTLKSTAKDSLRQRQSVNVMFHRNGAGWSGEVRSCPRDEETPPNAPILPADRVQKPLEALTSRITQLDSLAVKQNVQLEIG
ncbi:hypothetical protein Q1695_006260 [Nippostrongylus brasiliensis]|nr:hypothetical protein Q1695_006260 [Nippostrongylus brasiliensis]